MRSLETAKRFVKLNGVRYNVIGVRDGKLVIERPMTSALLTVRQSQFRPLMIERDNVVLHSLCFKGNL